MSALIICLCNDRGSVSRTVEQYTWNWPEWTSVNCDSLFWWRLIDVVWRPVVVWRLVVCSWEGSPSVRVKTICLCVWVNISRVHRVLAKLSCCWNDCSAAVHCCPVAVLWPAIIVLWMVMMVRLLYSGRWWLFSVRQELNWVRTDSMPVSVCRNDVESHVSNFPEINVLYRSGVCVQNLVIPSEF